MNLNGVSKRVAEQLAINPAAVKMILREGFKEIIGVLQTEEPVSIPGFGDWYFTYTETDRDKRSGGCGAKKTARFSFVNTALDSLNGRTVFTGIKNSHPKRDDEGSLRAMNVDPADVPMLAKAVHSLRLEKKIRLRMMDEDVALEEVCANISHMIDKLGE